MERGNDIDYHSDCILFRLVGNIMAILILSLLVNLNYRKSQNNINHN